MPRLRKIILNNQVYFVTLSVEEGIMLPANPLVKFLIKSALVKAYQHHQLEINHFIVNGTHMHMIVRIDNPEDLPKFMERFKTESAHYLNRILGRKKRTVWCARYDSPALLTPKDVINKIVYLYTNPVKDGLIESIQQYPGLSSWYGYQKNLDLISSSLVARDSLFPVSQIGNYQSFEKVKRFLLRSNKRKARMLINYNGWMKAFGVTKLEDINAINNDILVQIKKQELEIQESNESFKGRSALENQGIDLSYVSSRSGKKMWCISCFRNRRKAYINYAKNLCEYANEVYQKICAGDFAEPYPAGLFPPRLPILSNLIEHRY